jgi:integrase
MAIKTYVNEQGEILFQAYVNIRSKNNPSLRAQRKVSGIKTQRDAEREEMRLIRECERSIFEEEEKGESWGTLIEKWEEYLKTERQVQLNPLTRSDYVAALRKHTLSWWQKKAVTITRSDIREVLNQLHAHGNSISYQHKIKVIIHRVFVFGIETGLVSGLHQSPAYGIKLEGRKSEKKPDILTVQEIRKLLQEAKRMNHSWFPIWAIAVLTGMRNGELFALTWDDVGWEARSLSVTKSYNTRLRAVKSTKSGDWRTVPISTELMNLLQELKTQTGGEKHLLPRVPGWSKGEQARELRKFCQGIGITPVKFHALRACFATQLIRVGIPPIQIQKICGWKDLETMQRYIRLAGIETEGVTEALKVMPSPAVMETVSQTLASTWLPRYPTT